MYVLRVVCWLLIDVDCCVLCCVLCVVCCVLCALCVVCCALCVVCCVMCVVCCVLCVVVADHCSTVCSKLWSMFNIEPFACQEPLACNKPHIESETGFKISSRCLQNLKEAQD